MSAIFERAATLWVRYDTYEIRTADNDKQYLTPAAGAMPEIIDPLEDAKQMVLDAINIGLMIMGHRPKVPPCPPPPGSWTTSMSTSPRMTIYERSPWKHRPIPTCSFPLRNRPIGKRRIPWNGTLRVIFLYKRFC